MNERRHGTLPGPRRQKTKTTETYPAQLQPVHRNGAACHTTQHAPPCTDMPHFFLAPVLSLSFTVTHVLCPGGPNGELLQRDRADVDLDAPDADQALAQELGHHRVNQDLCPPLPLHQDVADLRRPRI